MKDYMKDMFMGGEGYEADPEDFPQSNYQMDKDSKIMKYDPSEAVDEYIEAFAYPGMTNLVYDEIKPDDEMIGKQIKGDSKNGNAVTGKDGKALGNVSKRSTKVGDRFKKNFDENLYGAEQMNASYKRQSQPVDEPPSSGHTRRGWAGNPGKARRATREGQNSPRLWHTPPAHTDQRRGEGRFQAFPREEMTGGCPPPQRGPHRC